MCADKFKRSEDYSKTRGSFDELGVEEQAVFIVEAAVNMIVKSVQKAGDAFSKAVEEMKMEVETEEQTGSDDASKEKKKAAAPKSGAKKKSSSGDAKAKTSTKSKSK